ncbi:MAG: hypothetical protein ACM3SY_15870 [Candidatus Omnitrophota bacterium]
MSTIIFGNVNANGTVYSGTGFIVVHDHEGEYTIVFLTPFKNVPAVASIQNYPGWSDFGSGGGNTVDNTVLIAVTREKFKIKTGTSAGAANDRNFTFIAIGD